MPAGQPRKSGPGGREIRKNQEASFSRGMMHRAPGGTQWKQVNPGVQRGPQTGVLGSPGGLGGRTSGGTGGTTVHRSSGGNSGGAAAHGAGVGAAGGSQASPLGQVQQFNRARGGPGGKQIGDATTVRMNAAQQRAHIQAFNQQRRAQQQAQVKSFRAQQASLRQQQKANQLKTKFYQRELYRIGDFASKVATRIGQIPTAGGIGLLLLILFFFIFVVVKVSKNGTMTRAQLMFWTVLGQASLPPATSGGPGTPSSVIAQMTAPQPSGIGLSPSEQASNIQLAQNNVMQVGASPRPNRLPPVMPPLG